MTMKTSFIPEFIIYNRYQELERRERERKEEAWESELEMAMNSSDPLKSSSSSSINKTTEEKTTRSRIARHAKKCGVLKVNLMKNSQEDIEEEEWEGCSQARIGYLSLPDKETFRKVEEDAKLQNIEYIDRTPSPVDRP